MNVEIFTLCNDSVLENGSITINQSNDLLFPATNNLPQTLADGFIVVKIRFDTKNENPKKCIIQIKSPQNELIEEFETEVKKPSKPLFDTFTVPIKIPLVGISIPTFGKYNVSLQIDGTVLTEIQFYVIRPVSMN